jgi:hypothetical protein
VLLPPYIVSAVGEGQADRQHVLLLTIDHPQARSLLTACRIGARVRYGMTSLGRPTRRLPRTAQSPSFWESAATAKHSSAQHWGEATRLLRSRQEGAFDDSFRFT